MGKNYISKKTRFFFVILEVYNMDFRYNNLFGLWLGPYSRTGDSAMLALSIGIFILNKYVKFVNYEMLNKAGLSGHHGPKTLFLLYPEQGTSPF